MSDYEVLLIQDKLNRANCFNRLCDNCKLLCTEECLHSADTHLIRNYLTDIEYKYNMLKQQIIELDNIFSTGDFAKGLSILIKLTKEFNNEYIK